MRAGEEDVALKLLHTADWHLGRDFPSFSRPAQEKLRRARLAVLDNVFSVADQRQVDAVLCAGDLFDGPHPTPEWWRGLAEKLSRTPAARPIFLLPGNHDALMPGSVWDPKYGFRALLPAHVTVVDQKNAIYPLKDGAVLLASPCTSIAGHDDQANALPARDPGDQTIRIGMVHGSTFQMKNWEANFPIAKDAAEKRGLDYLAIGDTHAFRIYGERPPTVYPSAPEPCTFGEDEAGFVAVVFVKRSRQVRIEKEGVAYWSWESVRVRSLEELRTLVARPDLGRRVLRVVLDLSLPAGEYEEALRLLEALEGTDAVPPKAGVLQLDRSGLTFDTRDIDEVFANMPEAIKDAARRLHEREKSGDGDVARRALYHLYTLARKVA